MYHVITYRFINQENIFFHEQKLIIKGVLHLWPILLLFMHFSQKLQHIGDK